MTAAELSLLAVGGQELQIQDTTAFLTIYANTVVRA